MYKLAMPQQAEELLRRPFMRFCIVGTLGFIINAVLLSVLSKNLHSPFIAQVIASEIALFSNFMFHHHWTYAESKVHKTITTLVIQFHITSWMAILGSAAIVTIGVTHFHLSELVALAAASAAALLWNYSWSRYVIWREQSKSVMEVVGERAR